VNTKEAIRNLGKEKFAGSNIAHGKAYHSFDGLETSSYTGNVNQRVKLITDNYDVNGKTGVDLGCSVGGISIELSKAGASMMGYDHDYQAIEVAKAYSRKFNLFNIFKDANIDLEFIKRISDPVYSFGVWFSHWMWFMKQHGTVDALNALFNLGKNVPVLFFETSLGDGMAGKAVSDAGIDEKEMKNILQHCYKSVKKIGVDEQWRKRPIFMCEGCLPSEYKGYHNNKIERIGYNKIRKTQNKDQHIRELVSIRKITKDGLTKHFPVGHPPNDIENTIDMSYCGEPLTKLPDNWKCQAEEILQALKDVNIVHRDIIPRNLLIKDGVIKLIDFSWSGHPDEDTSKFPGRLGTDFRKYPGFDDRYSLYKSLEWIGENEKV